MPTCGGKGQVVRPTKIVQGNRTGTAWVPERRRTCNRVGSLPGRTRCEGNGDAMTDDTPAPRMRALRQVCPTCSGKGTVLVPRFGMSSDGTAGTVHSEERCKHCSGGGWLDRGSVHLS